MEHSLIVETFLPVPRAEVFAFFAAAENLERITPPELRFEVLTRTPIPMARGARIDYRLRLFGVPFAWKTLISVWEPGDRFVDEQLEGPYARWSHTHLFRDAEGGTVIRDEVRYRLPFSPLGELAYPLVRLQLRRIFDFRARRLKRLLFAGAGTRGGSSGAAPIAERRRST